ncbi:hypothetical protein EHS86_18680, partial [Erwinia amylovora]
MLPDGACLECPTSGSSETDAQKISGQAGSDFSGDRLRREAGRSKGALHQHRRYDASGGRSWQSSTFGDGQITRPADGSQGVAIPIPGPGAPAGVSNAPRGAMHP